jgi:hypothetical protein
MHWTKGRGSCISYMREPRSFPAGSAAADFFVVIIDRCAFR